MSELIEKLARALAEQDWSAKRRQGIRADEPLPWQSFKGQASAAITCLADNLTPEMVEAGLQAQCDLPGCEWTDAVSDGLAMVMRLKMEKALTAALRSAAAPDHATV